jgi:hypothetical protein
VVATTNPIHMPSRTFNMSRLVVTMDSKVHTVNNHPSMVNKKERTDNKMAMISSNLAMDNLKDNMLHRRPKPLGQRDHRSLRLTMPPRVRETTHLVRGLTCESRVADLYR